MKNMLSRHDLLSGVCCALLALLAQWSARAAEAPATNAVTSVGSSAYRINGADNPNLTLTRGQRYVFNVSASGHPFWIKTAATLGTGNAYNNGVVNNGRQNGTITFTVPASAPNTLYYICEYHSAMKGTLNIADAPSTPPPPIVQILSIEMGPLVVITSTGTNGWSARPEYSLSAAPLDWKSVAEFTNNLVNGTNTTSFAPINAANVFIRIRNSPN